MRLRLTLLQRQAALELPINTNYPIGAAIYATLERSSHTFADILHRHGFNTPEARQKFKFYTFSKLEMPQFRIDPVHKKLISESEAVYLTISSGISEFLEHLVTGLFSDGGFRIGSAVFEKGTIETLPEPAFTSGMYFTMLSPLAVSLMREDKTKEYLRYDDPRLASALKNNLLGKYHVLTGKSFPESETSFSIRFDDDYLNKQSAKGRGVEKLIAIREGKTGESKVKAIECPFTLNAHPELIQLGYTVGFGEHNSMGFGMVKDVC
jgi:CRISPR-associated endoribonuclease Cas6